jgi:putative oxidoreductase
MRKEEFMYKLREIVLPYIEKLDWLPGLAARLCIGLTFIGTGWGKLHHLDKVIAFFTSLGIPAARIQAPFVAGVELTCGTLVLIGLFTRVASVPLIGTMVVAILTAKRGDIHELNDLLFMPEFMCIVLLLWLIVKGAGDVSVDKVLTTKESS